MPPQQAPPIEVDATPPLAACARLEILALPLARGGAR